MTPREAFEKMRDYWVTGTEHYINAPDVVVETPFGVTKRVSGAENVREMARLGRAALPVTFTACNTIAIHDTIDPEVIVLSGEVARCLPGFVDEVAATIRHATLPLVARNVQIVAAELTNVHAATARAGIESLRREDDVIAAATNLP